MAKLLCWRHSLIIKYTGFPLLSTSKTSILPNAFPIAEKSKEGETLRNLRIAVTPTYGYGSNSYNGNIRSKTTSLAGDPKRLGTFQDIRSEILEKWNKRPQQDVQREWLKNIMFN